MINTAMLPYGFTAFTGVTWTNQQVDSYNALTKRIASFGDNVPEYLLNSRHKLFSLYSLPK